MDNPILATYIRPSESTKHVMVAYQPNIFSTNKSIAYVKNSDFFKSFVKGQEFKLPANPRPVFRFQEDGKRYEYSDGTPQVYLEW
jgi:hypothetical protein|tara:strand:+ start:1436 stop:1690 length:255 start_codon:yes stop_codon:yes gene_type:complete